MSVHLVDGRHNRMRYAAMRHSLLGGLRYGSGHAHPSCVCVCWVAQGQESPPWLLGPLEELHVRGRVMMNIVSAVAAARTTSTGSWEDEKGAQSLKVRACMRTLSAMTR